MPKPKPSPPERPRLTCSREEARQKLTAQIESGKEIASRAQDVRTKADLEATEAERRTWNEYNYALLRQICTTDELYSSYAGSGFAIAFGGPPPPVAEEAAEWLRGLREKVRKLESVRERLDLLEEAPPRVPAASTACSPPSTKVFIIHGHDYEAALELKELITERFTSLTPVLLSREAWKGRTVIEKLEQEGAKCGFAFAVFTPDDFVGPAAPGDQGQRQGYYQMRPNVLFELGWFHGRLRRDRTCILYRKGTQIPSDLEGLGWCGFTNSVREAYLDIERELKAAYGDDMG